MRHKTRVQTIEYVSEFKYLGAIAEVQNEVQRMHSTIMHMPQEYLVSCADLFSKIPHYS